ncbi:MAG: hypothetical protein ACE5GA_09285, partial [Candidatus Zixiibacteriota bacterium]
TARTAFAGPVEDLENDDFIKADVALSGVRQTRFHPTVARFELVAGAHETLPGMAISHGLYYRAPVFIGVGVSLSGAQSPLQMAMFMEMRHLPTSESVAETFSFDFGYWVESPRDRPIDNDGFLLGSSAGVSWSGPGKTRLISDIGYRLTARDKYEILTMAPCIVGQPCVFVTPEKRNIHSFVFSLGLTF